MFLIKLFFNSSSVEYGKNVFLSFTGSENLASKYLTIPSLSFSTSQFLSKNPYLKFQFKGAEKGEKVVITWTDLKGETQTSSAKIK